jgi:hypothetical protein
MIKSYQNAKMANDVSTAYTLQKYADGMIIISPFGNCKYAWGTLMTYLISNSMDGKL